MICIKDSEWCLVLSKHSGLSVIIIKEDNQGGFLCNGLYFSKVVLGSQHNWGEGIESLHIPLSLPVSPLLRTFCTTMVLLLPLMSLH